MYCSAVMPVTFRMTSPRMQKPKEQYCHSSPGFLLTPHGGHGWSTEFLYDTVKVKSQQGNRVTLTIDTLVLDEPYGRMLVTIENVNGVWLMASGFDDYEFIY